MRRRRAIDMVAALFMGAAIKPRPVFVKPGWAELTLLLRVSAGTTWHRLYPARHTGAESETPPTFALPAGSATPKLNF
jgi:hypothetical protein